MRILRRLLSAVVVLGLAAGLWTATDRRSGAHAANANFEPAVQSRLSRVAMTTHAQQQSANAGATTPPPTIFRQYCVGCHNDRMKSNYGNLSLEGVDVADVSGHVETLEKVVRKLRKGQMPPEGRPRPDGATLEAFVAALETSLDRAAGQDPNPGRVVTPRLNRVEYVNAIYDLFGLEVNGSELLPSDMAALGLDIKPDGRAIRPRRSPRTI